MKEVINSGQPLAKGVRLNITVEDQAPDCKILINQMGYDLAALSKGGKKVVDIGCGFGRTKPEVENAGGIWTGVEPFEGGAATVIASAEDLPFEDESYDVVVMTSVMEHVPNVELAFKEISRILKKGGVFVGYMAFMECFHEISYSHLSHKGIENYAAKNGMKLEMISGGRRFGIDYHLKMLLHPFPVEPFRGFIAWNIRTHLKVKSKLMYLLWRFRNKMPHKHASERAVLYYKVECLKLSNGFNHIIRKI
ncbi:MAG: class I SAM-dependent methyltransferase [Bacteroidia bacterium]